jgi:hypothetical protein
MGKSLTKQQREHYLIRLKLAYSRDPGTTIETMGERFRECSRKLVARARLEALKELGYDRVIQHKP